MEPQQSTPASIDELLAEAGWLRRLALRLAKDSATADDLTQSTLVSALEHPPEHGRPLRPWLGAVLRNLLRAKHRTDGRRRSRERAVARSEACTREAELLAQFEEQRRLEGARVHLDAEV